MGKNQAFDGDTYEFNREGLDSIAEEAMNVQTDDAIYEANPQGPRGRYEQNVVPTATAQNYDVRLVNSYFQELSSEPLLKPRQEFKFAATMWHCKKGALRTLRELERICRVHFEDTSEPDGLRSKALCALRNGGEGVERGRVLRLISVYASYVKTAEGIRARFINANLRLVAKIAKGYIGRKLPYLDLVQEGNLGLIKAVEKYDYTKGFRFSTYACWWIHQAMSRAVFYQTRTIRVPAYIFEKYPKVRNVFNKLQGEMGRRPLPVEVATKLDMSTDGVKRVLSANEKLVRLDSPIKDGASVTFMDMVEDPNSQSADSVMDESVLPERVNTALMHLGEREREVIKMRFGIGYDTPHTLDSVGKHLGLTRERIRQIENEALKRLQRSKSATVLRSLLEVCA